MSDIRALTVKRPWSGLIAHHEKRIENRSWPTPYRGTLLIHAGQGWDGAARTWFDHTFAPFVPDEVWDARSHPQGIVAVAELTGVCPGAPCDCGPWAMDGNRHWRLANVRALDTPVLAVGRLGLWRPDAEVLAAGRLGLWRPDAEVLAAVFEQVAA